MSKKAKQIPEPKGNKYLQLVDDREYGIYGILLRALYNRTKRSGAISQYFSIKKYGSLTKAKKEARSVRSKWWTSLSKHNKKFNH